jgi:processive 1,2-diacylglycerol beta-glucosyltransferase
VYRQTYLIQIKYVPWLWGIFYYAFDHPWFYYGLMRFLRRILNALTSRRFEDVLRQKRPDIIIATHFLAVEVSGNERRNKRIDAKIVSVVTDYMPHCVWMDEYVDAYVVAADFTKADLVRRGVSPEKVHSLGIPVQKKFLENKDHTWILDISGNGLSSTEFHKMIRVSQKGTL